MSRHAAPLQRLPRPSGPVPELRPIVLFFLLLVGSLSVSEKKRHTPYSVAVLPLAIQLFAPSPLCLLPVEDLGTLHWLDGIWTGASELGVLFLGLFSGLGVFVCLCVCGLPFFPSWGFPSLFSCTFLFLFLVCVSFPFVVWVSFPFFVCVRYVEIDHLLSLYALFACYFVE